MAAHDILLSNFVSFFHINNCSNTLNISDFDHIIISLFFSNKELSELKKITYCNCYSHLYMF